MKKSFQPVFVRLLKHFREGPWWAKLSHNSPSIHPGASTPRASIITPSPILPKRTWKTYELNNYFVIITHAFRTWISHPDRSRELRAIELTQCSPADCNLADETRGPPFNYFNDLTTKPWPSNMPFFRNFYANRIAISRICRGYQENSDISISISWLPPSGRTKPYPCLVRLNRPTTNVLAICVF